MTDYIKCPWCQSEHRVVIGENMELGLNEFECDDCGRHFHFDVEATVHIGEVFKTFPVKQCQCPECGFDYSKFVAVSTLQRITCCPQCRKCVCFEVVRESE